MLGWPQQCPRNVTAQPLAQVKRYACDAVSFKIGYNPFIVAHTDDNPFILPCTAGPGTEPGLDMKVENEDSPNATNHTSLDKIFQTGSKAGR